MKRRSTKHRQAILNAFEDHHLLSAKELEHIIVDADQSTIYRNLKRLESDGLLRSVQVGEVCKYELADKYAVHDHFICNNCEMVKAIYVDSDVIKSQLPTAEEISVTVRGVCDNCR